MDSGYPDSDPGLETYPDAMAGKNVPRRKSGQRSISTSGRDPSSPSSPPSLELPLLDFPPSSSSSPSSTFFPASFSAGEDPDSDHGSGETGNWFMAKDDAQLCGTDWHLISSSAFFDLWRHGHRSAAIDSLFLDLDLFMSLLFLFLIRTWPMDVSLGDDGSPSSPARASTPAGSPTLRLRITNIRLDRATLL